MCAIYQKKVSVGKFIDKKTLKEGELITIASEGKEIEGQFGVQHIFAVKLANGDEGNIAFNQKSINNCIDAFGTDSVKWIGKEVKVWKLRVMVSGKLQWVVYLSSPDAEMTDDGEFVLKGSEPTEIISEEDVPF
jgi:hypothetical protein